MKVSNGGRANGTLTNSWSEIIRYILEIVKTYVWATYTSIIKEVAYCVDFLDYLYKYIIYTL